MKNMNDFFKKFTEDFNRAFNDVFNSDTSEKIPGDIPATETSKKWYLKDNKYFIDIELPGFKKDEIYVELQEDAFVISAISKTTKARKKISVKHPSSKILLKILCTLENGILTISCVSLMEDKHIKINIV